MKYHFIPLGGTQSQLKYIAGLPSWALTSVFQLFFQHLPSIVFVGISERGSWEPISIHLIHLPLTSAILLFITIYQNHLTMYRWDLGPPTPCLPPGCPHRVILSPISGLNWKIRVSKHQNVPPHRCYFVNPADKNPTNWVFVYWVPAIFQAFSYVTWSQ